VGRRGQATVRVELVLAAVGDESDDAVFGETPGDDTVVAVVLAIFAQDP